MDPLQAQGSRFLSSMRLGLTLNNTISKALGHLALFPDTQLGGK